MIPAKRAFVLTTLVACGLGAYKHSLEDHSLDLQNEISRISLGDKSLRLIGSTAEVVEPESGLSFQARIDTGATRCSLHVAEWVIEDEFPTMTDNVGKEIRFRLANRRGQSEWLIRQVAEVAMIRTSEEEEMRYLVPISLVLDGLEREVLVSLNDRSEMDFAMLVGRNYLDGEFIVDVSRGSSSDQFLASSSAAIARMAP